MKKDIDTLISEERNEIISKYDKVRMGIFCQTVCVHSIFSMGVLIFFRGGRRASKLTHGRTLTTASVRSSTALASCSKLS